MKKEFIVKCTLILLLVTHATSAVVLDRPIPRGLEPAGWFENKIEIERRLAIIEARLWAWNYWEWRKGDLVKDEEVQHFVNELDNPMLRPLKEALELFADLTKNSKLPLEVLLKEREDLRTSFRHYMLTGEPCHSL